MSADGEGRPTAAPFGADLALVLAAIEEQTAAIEKDEEKQDWLDVALRWAPCHAPCHAPCYFDLNMKVPGEQHTHCASQVHLIWNFGKCMHLPALAVNLPCTLPCSRHLDSKITVSGEEALAAARCSARPTTSTIGLLHLAKPFATSGEAA